jgi:hypothetical protein
MLQVLISIKESKFMIILFARGIYDDVVDLLFMAG